MLAEERNEAAAEEAAAGPAGEAIGLWEVRRACSGLRKAADIVLH